MKEHVEGSEVRQGRLGTLEEAAFFGVAEAWDRRQLEAIVRCSLFT